MQDVSKGDGRTVLFVSHNMAAVRSLCQKGMVLRDGMIDYTGNAEDAVNYYLESTTSQSEDRKLMTDCIDRCKPYLKVSEIRINNTPYNTTSLAQGQEVLDVLIKGNTTIPMRCEVRMIIKKLDGTPMAGFVEGWYKGRLFDIQPGDFIIERHIRLPKYMADGDYLIDLWLNEPYRQNFFEAKNCQTIHIEGFYDKYARTIRLSIDGFIGLESL